MCIQLSVHLSIDVSFTKSALNYNDISLDCINIYIYICFKGVYIEYYIYIFVFILLWYWMHIGILNIRSYIFFSNRIFYESTTLHHTFHDAFCWSIEVQMAKIQATMRQRIFQDKKRLDFWDPRFQKALFLLRLLGIKQKHEGNQLIKYYIYNHFNIKYLSIFMYIYIYIISLNCTVFWLFGFVEFGEWHHPVLYRYTTGWYWMVYLSTSIEMKSNEVKLSTNGWVQGPHTQSKQPHLLGLWACKSLIAVSSWSEVLPILLPLLQKHWRWRFSSPSSSPLSLSIIINH